MRSRLIRVGLLLAVIGQIGWSFRPSASGATSAQLAQGANLFQADCSSCHGLDAAGTENGPSLRDVGPAAVDFMLSTGRMPLANPHAEPERGPAAFDRAQIDAMVAYLNAIAPGGEPIPTVDVEQGNLVDGARLFLQNCSACHGAGGTGDSVGGGQIAPSLDPPNATQIGEAIRIGPGVMPKFSDATLSQVDVDSVARYLLWLRQHGSRGGLQLGRVGAVAEGLIAVVVGLGVLVLVLKLTGSKT